jgi:ribosomal protein S27E
VKVFDPHEMKGVILDRMYINCPHCHQVGIIQIGEPAQDCRCHFCHRTFKVTIRRLGGRHEGMVGYKRIWEEDRE